MYIHIYIFTVLHVFCRGMQGAVTSAHVPYPCLNGAFTNQDSVLFVSVYLQCYSLKPGHFMVHSISYYIYVASTV